MPQRDARDPISKPPWLCWAVPCWAVLGLLWALPAGADWLITLEGRLIETRGPWTIEGEILTYTDQEGQEHTFRLDEIDLEASEETTALKAGKPYVPREETPEAVTAASAEDPPAKAGKGKKAKKPKPKVVLYTDARCPDCAKARELLRELGVEFVEKDIAGNWRAYKEYRKKAGRGGGVPLIDVDGVLVFRYDPRVVRRRVEEFLEKQADDDESDERR